MKIIDKLSLSYNGLFVKGTKQIVHLHQGDMDGACAVYSMMMALIIIKAIKRSEVMPSHKSKDGRTAKERLFKKFFEKEGFIRQGYELADLFNDFNLSSRKLARLEYFSVDDEDFIERILSALDYNQPVELGFCYKSGGHAVLAIGYEKIRQGIQFFCLDPGHPLEKGQYWNNVVTFKHGVSKMNGESLRDSYNNICQVKIDEAISVSSYQ